MNAFNRYAAILGFALVSAHAQAVEFSFTWAGTITDTLTGLKITSSAWSDTAAGNQFETATLSFATDGMGVYNPTENIPKNTNTPSDNANPIAGSNGNTPDALGNKGGDNDLILFSFSSPVSLQALTMLQFGGDSDLSLWAGTGSFSLSGMTADTATLYENTDTVAGIRIVDLVTFAGTYNWLAVAARIGHTDDLAKLTSLTVTPVAQPVPDAATWMTMLAGLGLVGFAVKRRTRT